MAVLAHLTFEGGGNASSYLREGWSTPEPEFTWAIGKQSSVAFPRAFGNGALALEMEVVPFIHLPHVPRQRLVVFAGTAQLGGTVIRDAATLCFDLPRSVAGETGDLVITLVYPDAAIPVSLGLSEDHRRLALMVRSMTLLETAAEPPILPRNLGPLRISEPTPAALAEAVRARTGLSTIDLLHCFESLGHNCEFGLMQRDLDAEPLGLLRFGGIEPTTLLTGLETAFAGIDDPHGLGLESGRMNERLEYLVRDARFGVRIHTGQFIDEVPPDAVDLFRMARHLAFLQRQFADVLRDASRIFVLHHPGVHDAAHALPILNRLRGHGDNALLYVTENQTVPAGTMVTENAHLLHGYIDRLVPMNEAKKINLGAWVSLCANAYSAARLNCTSAP